MVYCIKLIVMVCTMFSTCCVWAAAGDARAPITIGSRKQGPRNQQPNLLSIPERPKKKSSEEFAEFTKECEQEVKKALDELRNNNLNMTVDIVAKKIANYPIDKKHYFDLLGAIDANWRHKVTNLITLTVVACTLDSPTKADDDDLVVIECDGL